VIRCEETYGKIDTAAADCAERFPVFFIIYNYLKYI